MSSRTVRAARSDPRVALQAPGDKSISHRAVLFNALAEGRAEVRNLGQGQDVRSSIGCMRQLGVEINQHGDVFTIDGEGLHGLHESRPPLDCGNSGTTTRLLAGILAGQPFTSTLVGDQSLSGRPMGRIARPLRAMGAAVSGETLPMTVRGGQLRGGEYQPEVSSAQVKSCILLAGLFAEGPVTVIEPVATRDHTERLLRAQGARVDIDGARITVHPPTSLRAVDIEVPGDFSSAAFWIVAGCIIPGAEVTVRNVGINESRTGLLDVLREMGANVRLMDQRVIGGEPVADILASHSELRGAVVEGALIPRLIDEVPVLAVAAALASGRTEIRDAEELAVKESNRIRGPVAGLQALGVEAEARPDGMVIHGGAAAFGPATLDPEGDHRMAMAWAIAGLRSPGGIEIASAECASVSYPSFWEHLAEFQENG